MVITKAMSQVKDKINAKKMKRKRTEMRQGCQAHIVLRSTEDGSLR